VRENNKDIKPRLIQCAIRSLPIASAVHLTRSIAAKTKPAPVSDEEQAIMAGATRIGFGPNGTSSAWSWGAGPPVILVHGWGGRASQMAPLAASLAEQGFRAIALDVTGHSTSKLRKTKWDYFIRDIAELSRSVGGEIYAYVGHSAGGLTTMAAHSLKGIPAERFVCTCSPSHPFPEIVGIKRRLVPPPAVINRCKKFIAEQFETNWDMLETASAYAGADDDLLLCYDENDRYVSHEEGDKIHQICLGSQLVKTTGFGHMRLLASPQLHNLDGAFLEKSTSSNALKSRPHEFANAI
jgi:pimeloyl-ACP methyl ester carboxylesterase